MMKTFLLDTEGGSNKGHAYSVHVGGWFGASTLCARTPIYAEIDTKDGKFYKKQKYGFQTTDLDPSRAKPLFKVKAEGLEICKNMRVLVHGYGHGGSHDLSNVGINFKVLSENNITDFD